MDGLLSLVAFALFSPFISKASHKFGHGLTMFGELLLIVAEEFIRSYRGYLLAALGPLLIGFLFDLIKSWEIPIIIFILAVLLLIYFEIKAGRDEVTHH